MSNLSQTLSSYKYWILAALGLLVLAQFVGRADKRKIEPSKEALFQTEVASESRPVLVKFGATWCGPCKLMDDSLEAYEKTTAGKVKVVKIDVDAHPALAEHYGVRPIPHSFLFYQGKVISDQIGYLDAAELQSWVNDSTKNL